MGFLSGRIWKNPDLKVAQAAHSACSSVLRRYFLGLSPDIFFYWQPQAGLVGRFCSSAASDWETGWGCLLLQAPQTLEFLFLAFGSGRNLLLLLEK